MKDILRLRNADIKRLLVGIPEGHTHIRAVIETADGGHIVLQEATLAAIVRGYTAVKTSPTTHAIELRSAALPDRKKGYAEHQLVESGGEEAGVRREIAAILSRD